MFECADCGREFHGRSYGSQKYGRTLCAWCHRQRNEQADPTRRDHRLHVMRVYYYKGAPISERFPRVGKRFGVGGWLDPDVQAHHAAMMRKYFGEGERLCQDFV